MKRIDINADMGESYGRWRLGADETLVQFISSANIACGFHAGDWEVMAASVELTKRHGVSVGAHPSYPDLQGFGRRRMDLPPDEVKNLVLYQIGALIAIAHDAGVELQHVKPHGALYNDASRDVPIAEAIVRAIRAVSSDLAVYCLPDSSLYVAAKEYGLRVYREGFADRLYEPSGVLANRSTNGALLTQDAGVAQGVGLAQGHVVANGGVRLDLEVETICVHGDSPDVLGTARDLRGALEATGFLVVSPRQANGV